MSALDWLLKYSALIVPVGSVIVFIFSHIIMYVKLKTQLEDKTNGLGTSVEKVSNKLEEHQTTANQHHLDMTTRVSRLEGYLMHPGGHESYHA